MANVEITWNAPAIGTLGNITNFTVLRGRVTNANTTQTCPLLQVAAAAGPSVGSVNADVECVHVDATRLDTSHTDTSVVAGTYMYGVYSVNGAGANTCLTGALSVDTIVVA